MWRTRLPVTLRVWPETGLRRNPGRRRCPFVVFRVGPQCRRRTVRLPKCRTDSTVLLLVGGVHCCGRVLNRMPERTKPQVEQQRLLLSVVVLRWPGTVVSLSRLSRTVFFCFCFQSARTCHDIILISRRVVDDIIPPQLFVDTVRLHRPLVAVRQYSEYTVSTDSVPVPIAGMCRTEWNISVLFDYVLETTTSSACAVYFNARANPFDGLISRRHRI